MDKPRGEASGTVYEVLLEQFILALRQVFYEVVVTDIAHHSVGPQPSGPNVSAQGLHRLHACGTAGLKANTVKVAVGSHTEYLANARANLHPFGLGLGAIGDVGPLALTHHLPTAFHLQAGTFKVGSVDMDAVTGTHTSPCHSVVFLLQGVTAAVHKRLGFLCVQRMLPLAFGSQGLECAAFRTVAPEQCIRSVSRCHRRFPLLRPFALQQPEHHLALQRFGILLGKPASVIGLQTFVGKCLNSHHLCGNTIRLPATLCPRSIKIPAHLGCGDTVLYKALHGQVSSNDARCREFFRQSGGLGSLGKHLGLQAFTVHRQTLTGFSNKLQQIAFGSTGGHIQQRTYIKVTHERFGNVAAVLVTLHVCNGFIGTFFHISHSFLQHFIGNGRCCQPLLTCQEQTYIHRRPKSGTKTGHPSKTATAMLTVFQLIQCRIP